MNINSIICTNNFVINQIPLNLGTSWAGSTSHILLSNLRDRNKEQQLLLFDPKKKRRKKQWRVRMSFVIYHLPWPGDCESFFVLVCGCGSTERAQCHCTGHALSCTCKPGHTCLPGVQPPYIPHRAPPPLYGEYTPMYPPSNPLKQQAILPCSHSPLPPGCIIETFCHFLVAVCLPPVVPFARPFFVPPSFCMVFCCYCVFITAWWLQGKCYVYD